MLEMVCMFFFVNFLSSFAFSQCVLFAPFCLACTVWLAEGVLASVVIHWKTFCSVEKLLPVVEQLLSAEHEFCEIHRIQFCFNLRKICM